MQHVVLHAMWYEGTAQLLSLTEFKSHLFDVYFIGWTIDQQYGKYEKFYLQSLCIMFNI